MECILCGNETNFYPLKPRLSSADNYLCINCGLVFIPRHRGISREYYKRDGYYTNSANIGARGLFTSKNLLVKLARERVESMLAVYPLSLGKKSVLDVGCGYGGILYYLKHAFQCDVYGLEPSKKAVSLGTKMFSIPLLNMPLEEFSSEIKFDVIACNHTLEHVEYPFEFLGMARKLLSDDGILYVEVPNILKPSGRFSLSQFLYSEHIQTFSSTTLNSLLQMIDFSVVAFSDATFLKFFCKKRKCNKVDIPIPTVSAEMILRFLKEYEKNYKFGDRFYAYKNKLKYLMRLAYNKLLDTTGIVSTLHQK